MVKWMPRWTPGVLIAAVWAAEGHGQSLDELPGSDRVEEARSISRAMRGWGRVSDLSWRMDEQWLAYTRDGERYRVDLESGEIEGMEMPEEEMGDPGVAGERPMRRSPPRGRQRRREPSPCGNWIAESREHNVWLVPTDENEQADEARPITQDGHRKHRYGEASWVYGEELRQRTAMWWSPDGAKLAFYAFDESDVRDYYLVGGLTDRHTNLMVEGYPKAGEDNPVAMLKVYDVERDETVDVEVGDDAEQYVYRVQFSPNGDWLIFSRTNRRQNHLEIVAANPDTGASRVVLEERQDTWQHNRPTMRFLDDGQRFIWETEKAGWAQYELHHVEDGFIATLTEGEYPVTSILRVDEERGEFDYLANSAELPLNAQVHRASLEGSKQRRLTDPAYHHDLVRFSPDGRYFVARRQTVDHPPQAVLFGEQGREIAVLADVGTDEVDAMAFEPAELFSYTADDGETVLYGTLFKPRDFDPDRSYPLLIDVYGGPVVQRVLNTWRPIEPYCELGFVIARIDNRGTPNRGKAFESATYKQLGTVDLRDQVDGVRSLTERAYIDRDRVGIFGHSYGGYMAALAILKHPDVFDVAVAGGAVTDWRNYDTIYTERYMQTPEENPEGYDRGSCMTYADQLEGELLIMHGMVDDNVHPANAWQLVDALQEHGKRHHTMFFPDRGHGLGRRASAARWWFLYEQLIEDE